MRLCCPDVRAGRIGNEMAAKKRRRHTPDQIVRKLAEGDMFPVNPDLGHGGLNFLPAVG